MSKKADQTNNPDSQVYVDASAVRSLAELLNDTSLSEIEYETHGCRIRVARATASYPMAAPVHVASAHPSMPISISHPSGSHSEVLHSEPNLAAHPGAIKAPMVGTVYLSSQPGAPAFVKEGDEVKVGDTLLIIEAMKVMNPIKATKAGKVTHFFVENAEPVEYDHVLLIIE
jgi:acetyl-CoA carboxylase biotin carboxyl carrier protein